MIDSKINWNTFGHERVKSVLVKQLNSGQFPNAYLFTGVDGIGKKTLALEYAKKILAVDNLNNHPDFICLDSEQEITVETILDFIAKLNFRPFVAKHKVAIINNAQNLNVNSSNALLKTLEEASASTIIILITNNTKLLPTIISRCQVLKFNNFSEEDLKSYAKLQNLTTSPDILFFSFGKISTFKALVQDTKFLKQQQQTAENYLSFRKKTLAEKILAINEFAEFETEDLEKQLELWLAWQVKNLVVTPTDYFKLQAISDSIQNIKMNKNKKLILQNLFLKI